MALEYIISAKKIDMEAIPLSYILHVTGDNFFRSFVNVSMVCFGPARSDPAPWHFET